MMLNTETFLSPTSTFTTRVCLTIIKIVYYQHLLVSFEELLSLRLSDPFALVVGCTNNNWNAGQRRAGQLVDYKLLVFTYRCTHSLSQVLS